jgi:hypothetical protein
MLHTVKVIAGGLALLALCLLVGRLVGGAAPAVGMASAAKLFIPIFAIPAAVALLVLWKVSRG